MDISFKKIVELLEIDAPTHFTAKDKLDKENYVSCRIMGEVEKNSIIAGIHDPKCNYDSSDTGLHFPDISATEYYELETKRNSVAIKCRINDISNKMIVYLSEIPIVFATYCVLHEYGHWIYFLNTKMTPYEYCEAERKERAPYEKIAKELYEMPDNSPIKIALAEKFDREIYSQFSSEKAANKYAFEHIADVISKVRNFLGYSEQDLFNQH